MKIQHIALYVKNLELMRKFYEKYFKGISNEKYYNPKTGLQTYFLTFDGDVRLELMARPDSCEMEKPYYREGFTHLAISVGSQKAVDNLTLELKNAGFQVISGPRTTGDGYYESCILDPENNQIEITV